jgi:hypothetical protein
LLSFGLNPNRSLVLSEDEEVRPFQVAEGWLSIDIPSRQFACDGKLCRDAYHF